MNVDIRTVVLIAGLTHLVQVFVFLFHYRANPHVRGPGWWLAWSAIETVGFSLILLRGFSPLLPAVIVVQDPTLVLGTVCVYVGVRRFFGLGVNWRAVAVGGAAFLVVHLWFYVVVDSIDVRTWALDAALVVVAFATAHTLLRRKPPHVGAAATFTGALMAAHGLVFAAPLAVLPFRTLSEVARLHQVFDLAQYLDALFAALLWTFAFITMVNQQLNGELQAALEQVKTLRGIVPICSGCKKVRDDAGYWQEVERYVSRHTEARFSHGLCPDCLERLYPEFAGSQG